MLLVRIMDPQVIESSGQPLPTVRPEFRFAAMRRDRNHCLLLHWNVQHLQAWRAKSDRMPGRS